MAKILIRLPRSTKVDDRLVRLGTFKKHHIKEPEKGFNDHYTAISAEELLKPPHRFTQGKEEYLTLEADFLDQYKSMKRLAQIITLKDIGRIITLLGITKDSVVVEAGTGSGAATAYLAALAKDVHSYETNPEHLSVAKENCARYKNITFHDKDINDVEEHEADGFLLDVPEPSHAITSIVKALRIGGRCVIYSPNLTQLKDVIDKLPPTLLYERTIQLTETDWEIKERILRPRMQGLGHTAFLMLLRKLPP